MKRLLTALVLVTIYMGQAFASYAGESLETLQAQAAGGDATAQTTLGYRYITGEGVKQDFAEAAKWYTKAAEQGHAGAQGGLGMMYVLGHGVEKDYAEALKWLQQSAAQSNAHAHANLARMYILSQGLEQDFVQAHKHLSIAVALGEESAGQLREMIVMEMAPEQVAEGKRLAKEWQQANSQ